jgi:phosphoribosylglycinamide formyltransferase 1
MNIGILASHAGTTAQAVIDACERGEIAARVAVVISNNGSAEVLGRARDHRIPAVHLSTRTHPEPESLDQAIGAALTRYQVDLVLLAGYLRKLGPKTIASYRDRVINIHPALLPRHGGPGMYGDLVHRAVLESGDSVTGASIHLVTEEYDQGRVIAAQEVAVAAGDDVESLGQRVRRAERALLVATLAGIARGDLP